MLRRGYRESSDPRETPGARQPLVRTDPATGRRALFLGRRPHAWVVGLEVGESDALLDRLWAHASDPRFVWRHRWRPGDLLIWNNLGVLHRRDAFDASARRIMTPHPDSRRAGRSREAMKRFYRQAEAVPLDPDGYGVALDGRRVRTPAGRPLALPSRALAAAVADEWAGQGETVEPRTMAMMTLSATALDRVAPRAGEVAAEIARYGETDLLCYRDAAGGELARRQNAAWQPVLDWLAATHGAKLTTARGRDAGFAEKGRARSAPARGGRP